jgi:hypothetical protein
VSLNWGIFALSLGYACLRQPYTSAAVKVSGMRLERRADFGYENLTFFKR